MQLTDFKAPIVSQRLDHLQVKWQAPSNIALVKYWGKHGMQLPTNPSISFTLKECRTITQLTAQRGEHGVKVIFEGKENEAFVPKVKAYFERIAPYSPWVNDYHFTLDSSNTFPHSSGIASSASSMAALSAAIVDMEGQLSGQEVFDTAKASFLARLGSGSACRSISGQLVVWGDHQSSESSNDLCGVDHSEWLHPDFADMQDTILLVDKGQKTVSSTVGHGLMNEHPFAEQRFAQAHQHLTEIKEALQNGDMDNFIRIVESEALSLHAMMMTSQPYFILMKPNTVSIIEEIWAYRKATKNPVCFTLDAGANVHMLYPKAYENEIDELIKNKLAGYCENSQYICDTIGAGATKH